MTLGCGTWRAFVTGRGGSPTLAELSTYTKLSCSYVLNETGPASVVVPTLTAEPECCELLGRLQPWEHELALYRDDALKWVGVPFYPIFTRVQANVSARDLVTWFDRRLEENSRRFDEEDLSSIFATYFEDGLERDPSPNINVVVEPSGILGDRKVEFDDGRIIGDEMRELIRTGLDRTVIGRDVFVSGPASQRFARTPITDDQVDDPVVQTAGLSTATESTVIGREGLFRATSGGVTERFGLVQSVHHEPRIRDLVSAQAAADLRRAAASFPPTVIQFKLLATASVEFDELVPGTVFDTRLTVGCRKVEEPLVLTRVDVTADPTESVICYLTSRGADATSDETGGSE